MSPDVWVALTLVLGTFAACLLHSVWHYSDTRAIWTRRESVRRHDDGLLR